MLRLKSFTFNPFQENTYVIYNEEGIAMIVDPGNSNASEDRELGEFITVNRLKPERLLLTHAHIDHVMGLSFVHERYGLKPEVHRDDLFFINRMKETAHMYGLNVEPGPQPEKFISDGDVITLGKYEFRCIHTPGHSPGSIAYYNEANRILLSGDVLFHGSIGRTDLPMGDYETLMTSIREKVLPLGDDVKVYSGHGASTTCGVERRMNPFLLSEA